MLRSFTEVRVRDDWGEGGCSEVQFYNFFFKRKKKKSSFSSGCFCSPSLKSYFSDLTYIVVFFSRGGWGQRGALCGSHEGPGSLSFEKRAIDCLKKSYSPCIRQFSLLPNLQFINE